MLRFGKIASHRTSRLRTDRLREETRTAARHARREVLVLGPLLAAVLVFYAYRSDIVPGLERPAQWVTALALVILGWALARDIGRALGPLLLGRLDPATAGTVGFLIRLGTVALAVIIALRVAGLPLATLALGASFTAVVVGLAAQQTLGNLIAGTVLLSARPFRVGEHVRFQAGGLAGEATGVVTSLGLLYTTLQRGADEVLIPNSLVLSAAIIPLREPAGLDFVARLQTGVRPSDVQRLIEQHVTVATRSAPHVELQELDDDEVVVRVSATPVDGSEGGELADQVLAAVDAVVRGEVTMSADRQPGHVTVGAAADQ